MVVHFRHCVCGTEHVLRHRPMLLTSLIHVQVKTLINSDQRDNKVDVEIHPQAVLL